MPVRRGLAGQRLSVLTGALVLVFGFLAVGPLGGSWNQAPRSSGAVVSAVTEEPQHEVVDPPRRAVVEPVSPPSPVARSSPSPSPRTSVRSRRERIAGIRPTRVRIPAIGVAAPVIELGLTSDGMLEVPASFGEAGWWTGGAMPGSDGPAVVAGHVDSRAGPGVFYRLRELRPGDAVELWDDDGRVARFAVDRLEQHAKERFPTDAVYGDTADPSLRVITCGGAFDRTARSYVDNVIVYASLVD